MSSEFPDTNIEPSNYDTDVSSSSYLSPAPTISLPTSSARTTAVTSSRGSDLERLRDILFGSQTRSAEQRLSDLENQLERTDQEFAEIFSEKVDTLQSAYSTNLNSTRKELSEGLEEQNSEQMASLRAMEQSLTERFEKQELQRKTELRNFKKKVNDRVEELAEDFFTQLRNTQRELTARLEQMNGEQTNRVRSLQNDSRKRNIDLRQELLSLAASLQDSKISRHELGQQLQELGQRLRSDPHTMR